MVLTIANYMRIVEMSPDKKREYDARYKAIEQSLVVKWYNVNNKVILHVRIPSEKAARVMYDVLLEFAVKPSATIKEFKKSPVRVFSNCPSYIFTNAKFCSENKIQIEWAEELLNQEVLSPSEKKKKEDEEKAQHSIKCEKSLYFAMKYLLMQNPIKLLTALNGCIKLPNEKSVLRHIKDPDTTLEKRQNAKPIKKKIPKDVGVKSLREQRMENRIGNVRVSQAITKAKSVSSSKAVGSTKKIKHI